MPLPRPEAVTMLERLQDFAPALADPQEWAIATVVAASGSVPRPPGTSMAVRRDGLAVGSVSGGCVEAAVVDACLTVFETGTADVVEFGYDDEHGLGVGLTCGGSLQVLVQPMADLREVLPSLAAAAEKVPSRPVALVRALPGAALGLPAPALLDPAAALPAPLLSALPPRSAHALRSALEAGGTRVVPVHAAEADGCPVVGRLLVESHRPPPRLVVYGANDFAAALAAAARPLGWFVTVCDARPLFSTAARHPWAHEVVTETPAAHLRAEQAAGRLDARTAVAVLGHDPRFDLAVLDQALRMDLAYVGALGSRTTHERRVQDLLRGGLPEALLGRLHSPIGLDLGARTPEEVAVAILAEVIAARRGRGRAAAVRPLSDTAGPVHAAGGAPTAPGSWKVQTRWT